jgi:hypothetical protein
MFFTALMNIIIYFSKNIFLFRNHWNTVLMNIINLLLNEHVRVCPINNVLITVLVFDYCLIRTGLFYGGFQCPHYPCRCLMYIFILYLTMTGFMSQLCMY